MNSKFSALQDRYSSLYDVDGNLERPVAGSRWEVPDVVRLDGRFLLWEAQYFRRLEEKAYFSKTKSPGERMLEHFVRLENAGAKRILAYAQRWGLLHTRRVRCRRWHFGVPAHQIDVWKKIWVTRKNELSQEHNDREANFRKFDQNGRFCGREPLYIWRYWAKALHAALRVGGRLVENTKPELKDWEIMTGIYPPIGRISVTLGDTDDIRAIDEKKLALQRAWLNGDFYQADQIWHDVWELKVQQGKAFRIHKDGYRNLYIPANRGEGEKILDEWAAWSLCHPLMPFSAERLWFNSALRIQEWQTWAGVGFGLGCLTRKVEIYTNTLFAGLVWQLMAAFGRCGGLAICECGQTYRPKRNCRCCEECRKNAPQRVRAQVRQRVRRFRIRKKASSTVEAIEPI